VKRLFVLTPGAKRDLKEIFLDIAEDSPDTAERLRSEFYELLQNLGRSSGIGHYHEELLSRKYRFWNFYSYVVVYVWDARPIQVIAVVHGARDLAVFLTLRQPN
jgi:plasmid stabilization system protein ParE